ncbi:hypothetical protein WJX84_008289 [Apatococcus fuscideae]|uniref:Uncharacterized protein n=1 Tax=Apatococcus fuscideae TaxID=2026836 RepID=A0AAW1T8Z1_9CHLO
MLVTEPGVIVSQAVVLGNEFLVLIEELRMAGRVVLQPGSQVGDLTRLLSQLLQMAALGAPASSYDRKQLFDLKPVLVTVFGVVILTGRETAESYGVTLI